MKISVDGGALNQKIDQRFGTAVFSENIIKALQLYDDQNIYHIYTFKNLRPKIFWMKGRISIEEIKENKDIFLALNQALPLYASGKIISFCHGLSYRAFPQYYQKVQVARLERQLKEMIKRSDRIIVSTQKVKDELILINRSISAKIIVLPFGAPFDMKSNVKDQKSKIKKRMKYFIFVANNQPIKNIDFILQSFNRLKSDAKFSQYKLYLIGDWKKYDNKNAGIKSFGSISRDKLKNLYQDATALLTTSYYESFNFPVLEALSLGCPVIGLKSAIIPELKTYVNSVRSVKDFVDQMKKPTIIPTARLINRLYGQFNWENYVKNLVDLY